MNELELKQRIEDVCKDEEYVKYLLSLNTAEKMSEELKTKDIDISPEELHQIGTLVRKKENGELSDEELENIAGGAEFLFCFGIALGVILGSGITGGLVARAACS